MLYHVHCFDKPDHTAMRAANREAHLAHLAKFTDAILVAGPTLAADGQTPSGSVIIIDLPDQAAVDAFCANDPYAKAGLFQRVEVTLWRKTLPKD
ncbi:MAG: YciI family protein [Rhodospirillaceae bacterium]|nr:YciI family protein [Rhodospirillaceae bacterium]